jgi:hypothetical protein
MRVGMAFMQNLAASLRLDTEDNIEKIKFGQLPKVKTENFK